MYLMFNIHRCCGGLMGEFFCVTLAYFCRVIANSPLLCKGYHTFQQDQNKRNFFSDPFVGVRSQVRADKVV